MESQTVGRHHDNRISSAACQEYWERVADQFRYQVYEGSMMSMTYNITKASEDGQSGYSATKDASDVETLTPRMPVIIAAAL